MGVSKTDLLGSNGRLQEKIKQLARATPSVSSSTGDGDEVEGLRNAIRVLQLRERELHQQLEDANITVKRERERNKVASTPEITVRYYVIIYVE